MLLVIHCQTAMLVLPHPLVPVSLDIAFHTHTPTCFVWVQSCFRGRHTFLVANCHSVAPKANCNILLGMLVLQPNVECQLMLNPLLAPEIHIAKASTLPAPCSLPQCLSSS